MNLRTLIGNRLFIETVPDPTDPNPVKPLEPARIFVPETVKQPKPAYGRVLMKGQGATHSKRLRRENALMADVNPGDIVRIDRSMGSIDAVFSGHSGRIVAIMDVQMVVS